MDAKQACDKLNGFNFQSRYLVGKSKQSLCAGAMPRHQSRICEIGFSVTNDRHYTVLYHQPEKMAKTQEDLAERQENLEKLKRQHGIE